jgi:uncharacterized protein YjbI with pentapeptide repeats
MAFWIALVLFSLVIVLSKLLEYEWSGLQNKNLWDWLSLLFVPVILATGGFYLQQQAEQRQKDSDEKKAQQQALIEYFKNVKDLVKFKSPLNGDLTKENKELIESFTLVSLPQISGDQKGQVVQFLYGLGLIRCKDICYKNNGENTKNLLDLNEADLSNAKLKDMDLKNLYLPSVNLKGADFTSSILDGASLDKSNLEKLNLELASIKIVKLASSKFGSEIVKQKWIRVQKLQSLIPVEKDESLPPCDFYKTGDTQKSGYKDYSGRDISATKLEKLDLRNFNFEGADLSGTSLKQSFLGRANLKNAKLKDVNLEGAYLKDVTIDEASKRNLNEKTRLIINLLNSTNKHIDELKKSEHKDLSNSDLSTIEITGNSEKDMKHINLRDSKLNCSILENIDMSGDSDLNGADLSNAELTNINFSGANLKSANLKGTIMNNVNLSNAVLFAADLSNATIKGDMQGANLNSATLKGADLSEAKNLDKVADFNGATYDERTKFPKNFNYKKPALGLSNAKN